MSESDYQNFDSPTGVGIHLPSASNSEIVRLRQQLAERDAALARCVEALGTIELEASFFRVDPPMSEDELMAKFEAISELAGNTLESLPSSAKATAKVLAAARRLGEAWKRYDLVEKEELFDASRDVDAAEIALYEAIREEKEWK